MYSIFSGKTIESVENRDSVRICRTKKEYIQETTKKTTKQENKTAQNKTFLTIFAETQADPGAPGARGVGSMGPGRLHGLREAMWSWSRAQ